MSIWGKILFLFVLSPPTSEKEQNSMTSNFEKVSLGVFNPSPPWHIVCLAALTKFSNLSIIDSRNQFRCKTNLARQPDKLLNHPDSYCYIFQIRRDVSSFLKWDYCVMVLCLARFIKPSQTHKKSTKYISYSSKFATLFQGNGYILDTHCIVKHFFSL